MTFGMLMTFSEPFARDLLELVDLLNASKLLARIVDFFVQKLVFALSQSKCSKMEYFCIGAKICAMFVKCLKGAQRESRRVLLWRVCAQKHITAQTPIQACPNLF